jgi:threonine dehydrogenase-like Zn-dependent dehydrogenase
MRAIVLAGLNDVRVESVPDATLRDASSALVRVTRASICGSDLHLVHGATPTMPGIILGHEAVGVVDAVGADVRRFRPGDRVLVPAVAGCGFCDACRTGYVVGCRTLAGFTEKIYGTSPDLPGGQAEAVCVPYADTNLWHTPSELGDEQVLMLTDIFATGHYAATNAAIRPGDVVVVIGCGPVGLAALLCAQLFGPAQILAVDRVGYRLAKARQLGATPVDAGTQDVAAAVLEATDGQGAHAVIEAVGAPETFHLAFDLVRLGGTVSAVGVLLAQDFPFPMGTALMKDLTFRIGLVNVPGILPALLPLVRSGRLDPTTVISHHLPLAEGRHAYDVFGGRKDGCLKVVLTP